MLPHHASSAAIADLYLARIRAANAPPPVALAPPPSAPQSLPEHPPDFEGELLRHVAAYEARGWQLSPLRTYVRDGEVKQHPPKGWPERRGTLIGAHRDASNRLTHGVALVLGPSGVVDIDLDSDAARDLAPKFLRPTATFGRKGRTTHYVYQCPAQPHPINGGPEQQARTRAFKHERHGMLVELRRGPGAQTTPPPTIKPDGYPAVWAPGWQDAIVTWEPLDERRVEELALACLIALDGNDGDRHHSRMRWAGELARRGMNRDLCERVLTIACEYRGDDDLADLYTCLESTFVRVENGESVIGVDAETRRAVDAVLGRVAQSGARVNVSAPLDEVLGQIGTALRASDPPAVFRQGDAVVTLHGEAKAEALCVEAARAAHFVRSGREGDVITHPSVDLLRKFAASRPELPELLGRRGAPILRPDGSLFSERGYDAATRLWCDWEGSAFGDDPAGAATRLLAFVEAGQWEEPADRIAWLAHVLTVAARPAIDGPVPAWIYSSPVPGSGKSTLARVAGAIGGRCDAFTDPSVRDDDELARRLDTFAMRPAVVLDNARGVFKSPLLEGALAGESLTVRRLYVGPVTIPWRTVLSVTSNGAEIGRDWARRTLPVRLNGRALPGGRDVLGEAKRQHALTVDALTVVGSWLRSGVTSSATPLLGFAEWSRVVGGAIAWLGLGDVVSATRAGAEGMVAVGDDATELLDAIERWLGETGRAEFDSRELWQSLAMRDLRENFRDSNDFGRRLGRTGDATRVLRNRRSNGRRVWRVEPR